MVLTHRQLRRLGLAPDTIDAVMRLHQETVHSLRQECDAWHRKAAESDAVRRDRDELRGQVQSLQGSREEAAALRTAFDAYRQETEQKSRQDAAVRALTDALRQRGANELAIPLLLRGIPLESVELTAQGTDAPPRLENEAALLDPLMAQYGGFFAQPQQLGIPTLEPPMGCGALLTAGDLRGMSTQEINQNWPAVKSALANPDN